MFKCATRGSRTLDKVYTNIILGYRARPLSHLGQSDHLSLLLIAAYAPIKKTADYKRMEGLPPKLSDGEPLHMTTGFCLFYSNPEKKLMQNPIFLQSDQETERLLAKMFIKMQTSSFISLSITC